MSDVFLQVIKVAYFESVYEKSILRKKISHMVCDCCPRMLSPWNCSIHFPMLQVCYDRNAFNPIIAPLLRQLSSSKKQHLALSSQRRHWTCTDMDTVGNEGPGHVSSPSISCLNKRDRKKWCWPDNFHKLNVLMSMICEPN